MKNTPTITFNRQPISQVVYESFIKRKWNKNGKFNSVQPIFTSSIPIDSAQQAEQNETSKNSKFHSRGAPGEFPWKNTPNDNFLTVQPIFTSSIPIDSAEQEEQNWNIKKLKISF